jgi:hypothetical protein
LRKGGGREDGGEDGGGGGTKVSNIRRNATGFETEIETVRAGGDELRHNRGFSRRKRLGKGEFSGNAVKAEKVPYLDMDMKKREKEVTLEPAKKMRLGEVKVGNVRRNGIRLSAIEEGDELASPAANSLSGRGDGIKVSNVVRNGRRIKTKGWLGCGSKGGELGLEARGIWWRSVDISGDLHCTGLLGI